MFYGFALLIDLAADAAEDAAIMAAEAAAEAANEAILCGDGPPGSIGYVPDGPPRW